MSNLDRFLRNMGLFSTLDSWLCILGTIAGMYLVFGPEGAGIAMIVLFLVRLVMRPIL